MRDKLKDKKYFDEYLEKNYLRVRKYEEKIASGTLKEDRIIPVKTTLNNNIKLDILIAKYSRGDDLNVLRDEFLAIFKEWTHYISMDAYNENIRMLSLALLFNINSSEIVDTASIEELYKKNDWLITFLLNVFLSKEPDNNCEFIFPKGLSTLKKAYESEKPEELIQQYLEYEWYRSDCGYYEDHKSEFDIYVGYWSFEAGAIAKIIGINDTGMEEMDYYPYDLVHFK